METALRHPDVREDSYAADRKSDVAGPPHIRHALGAQQVGCFQVSACPVGESQDPSRDRAMEKVILRHEIECLSSVLLDAGQIAERLGQKGTGRGYLRW